MTTLLFITNLGAGKSLMRSQLPGVIDTFIKANYEVSVHITQSPQDGYKKFISSHDRFDMIVCSGGDGTLNEIVSAAMEVTYTKPIAYIPTGTSNDFATTSHISKDPITCAKEICKGKVHEYDIGKFNEKYFTFMCGFGIFSDVSYTTPQSAKNILGYSAYVIEGVKQWFSIPKYKINITYENTQIEGEYCYGMISNGSSIGGFTFFNEDDIGLNDHLFECLFVKKPNNPLDVQNILTALLSKKPQTSPFIDVFTASELHISCKEQIKWTIDGEYGGKLYEASIKNLHKAITLRK